MRLSLPPAFLRFFKRLEKRPIGVFVLFSGALMTLGFAPFFWWPFSLLSLAFLLALLVRAKTWKQALGLCFVWGIGWQLTALYWLPRSFYLDADRSLLAGVFGGIPALLVVAAYGALGVSVAGAVAFFAGRRWCGPVFVAVLMGCEFLKSLGGMGFPWLPLGAIWGDWLAVAQLASLGGIYLLSFFTLFLVLLLASGRPKRWLLAGGLLAVVAGYGYIRLAGAPTLDAETAGQPVLRLVQPNQQSPHKWNPVYRMAYLKDALDLALSPVGSEAIPYVIFPESAVAFFLEQEPEARSLIERRLAPGQQLITGTVRAVEREGVPTQYFNSIRVITRDGITSSYDKRFLVPFGEFIPGRSFLDLLPLPTPLRTLSQSRIDFTHGARANTLALANGSRVGGLVCYEAIFPLLSAREAAKVDWFVNVTNDNWFTGTTALAQHATLAKFRAIETGKPLIRVANTGLTVVYDGFGREVRHLPINRDVVLDVPLPRAAVLTPFARVVGAF